MSETNELFVDRRGSYGRRASGQFNLAAMRGFHEVANSVGADEGLIASVLDGECVPPSVRRRLSLVHREQQWLLAFPGTFLDRNRGVAVGSVEVRELVESVATRRSRAGDRAAHGRGRTGNPGAGDGAGHRGSGGAARRRRTLRGGVMTTDRTS